VVNLFQYFPLSIYPRKVAIEEKWHPFVAHSVGLMLLFHYIYITNELMPIVH